MSDKIHPNYLLLFLASHPKEHIDHYKLPITVEQDVKVTDLPAQIVIEGQQITVSSLTSSLEFRSQHDYDRYTRAHFSLYQL